MKHLNDRQEYVLPPLSEYVVTFKDYRVLPKIGFWDWMAANPKVAYESGRDRKIHMLHPKPKDVEVVLPKYDTDSGYSLVWEDD